MGTNVQSNPDDYSQKWDAQYLPQVLKELAVGSLTAILILNVCTNWLADNFQFIQCHSLPAGLMPISQCAILTSRCSKIAREQVKGCDHYHDHVAWWRSISVLFQKCTWLWMQMVGKEINYFCHIYLKCQRKAMEIHRTYKLHCLKWKMGNNNYLFVKSPFLTPGFLFGSLYCFLVLLFCSFVLFVYLVFVCF